jgi:hypothetical protein
MVFGCRRAGAAGRCPPVPRLRHPASFVLAALLAAALAACTGSGHRTTGPTRSTTPGTATSGSSASSSTSPAPTVTFTGPGLHFVYSNPGLLVTLTMQGNRGSLHFGNSTGSDLGGPVLYALDARSGARVDAALVGPPTVGEGSSGYQVSFPGGFDARRAGLFGLVVGGEDIGALAPAS